MYSEHGCAYARQFVRPARPILALLITVNTAVFAPIPMAMVTVMANPEDFPDLAKGKPQLVQQGDHSYASVLKS